MAVLYVPLLIDQWSGIVGSFSLHMAVEVDAKQTHAQRILHQRADDRVDLLQNDLFVVFDAVGVDCNAIALHLIQSYRSFDLKRVGQQAVEIVDTKHS
jgi:hypothetical protein